MVERTLFSPIAEECSADEESSHSASSIHANASSSPGMLLTEDLSDLTLSPSGPEDNDVSFKTEVAFSPQHSPEHRDKPGRRSYASTAWLGVISKRYYTKSMSLSCGKGENRSALLINHFPQLSL